MIRSKSCLQLLTLAACTVLGPLPATVIAQTQQATLEEIIVTAQRREEGLQETPISISAFTPSAIQQLGATNIQEVAEFAPNVVFDFTAPISGASNAAGIFIRGIGQSDFALTTEAGVGTYVDGVYMSRSIGGVLDVLDVGRIEILRGPQGTLFGRNTIGGAINISSTPPGHEFGGKLEVSGGAHGRVHLRGVVDLPISESLSVRLAASSKDRDGYVQTINPVDTTDPGLDLGNENRQAFRGSVAWQASDSVSLNFTADYSRTRENNAASILRGTTGFPNPLMGAVAFIYNVFGAPVEGLVGFQDSLYSDANFVTGDLRTSYSTGPNGTSIDAWGLAATVDWALSDQFSLKSITAYRDTKGFVHRDADGSPINLTHTSNYDYRHEQFSQEIQAIGDSASGRLRYVGGLYFFSEEGSDPILVPLSSAFGTVHIPVNDIENTSYAAYVQANFDVSDAVTLTGGIRYTKEEKEFFTNQFLEVGFAGPMNPFLMFAPAGLRIPLVPPNSLVEADFDDLSPRISLDYKLNDNLLLYTSYAQGFKSGGFNLRYVVPRNSVLPFDSESVSSAEVGFKYESANQRLRLNGAGFYTEYDGIQVTVFEGLGAPVTLNAGDAEIRGAELELAALATDNLQVSASLGWTDAEYTELRSNPAFILTPEQEVTLDSRLPNAPEFQYRVAIDYSMPMANSGSIDLHIDSSHTDDIANDAQNSHFLFQDAYNIVNAGLTYNAPSENWSVSFFVDNVTDKRYIVSGDSNFGIGFHEANFNRPREWYVTLRIDF